MLKHGMQPPPNTKEVFMGCGAVGSNVLRMGVFGTPEELFDHRFYPQCLESNAKAVRNYHAYYATESSEGIGFSKGSTVNLCSADIYDYDDESKMSGHTSTTNALWRCGSEPHDFLDTFKIVFYSRS